MKLSAKTEEALHEIMQVIDKLEWHGVEVNEITIKLHFATYEEENKAAKILGIETIERP